MKRTAMIVTGTDTLMINIPAYSSAPPVAQVASGRAPKPRIPYRISAIDAMRSGCATKLFVMSARIESARGLPVAETHIPGIEQVAAADAPAVPIMRGSSIMKVQTDAPRAPHPFTTFSLLFWGTPSQKVDSILILSPPLLLSNLRLGDILDKVVKLVW